MKIEFPRFLILLLGTLLFPLAPPLVAATHYVDFAAIGDADGTSWEDAFPNLQDGLAAAASGDEVWVAWGVYYPDEGVGQTDNDPTSSFQISNGVSIYGGFAGYETATSERNLSFYNSILSGDLEQNDPNTDNNHVAEDAAQLTGSNAYHVLIGAVAPTGALLDGFTITAGRATGGGTSSQGGGLILSLGGYTIRNCNFSGNFANNLGGAVYTDTSNSTFTNCLFSGNAALSAGGGIMADSNSPLTLTNVAFVGNLSSLGAAAFFNDTLQNLTNCSFSGNQAVTNGGAIMANGPGTTIDLTNCIIWNNSASGNVGSAAASITTNGGASYNADYTLMQNLNPAGVGNLDGTLASNDPEFVDPPDPALAPGSAGDLRLSAGSPMADLGQNSANSEPRDLAGQLRIIDSQAGGGADIEPGAYELARIRYVDSTAGGIQTGKSWVHAFLFVQDALAAAIPGDEIRVAQGLYLVDEGTGQTNNDPDSTFQLVNDVTLLGGYLTGGSDDRDPRRRATVLSADIDKNDRYDRNDIVPTINDISGANAYRVVTGTGTNHHARVDGFFINAGLASADSSSGAGLYIDGGTPTFVGCEIRACKGVSGGGAFLHPGSHPTFTKCTFRENGTTIGTGGGVHSQTGAAPAFVGCVFTDNESLSGGGIISHSNTSNRQFQTIIHDCTFTGNTAQRAGAVYNAGGSRPSILLCTFTGNAATPGDGGAIYGSSAANAVIADCTFINNSAGDEGGAIYSITSQPSITDCVFVNNSAGDRAGALMNKSFSSSLVTRCDFIGNSSGDEGGSTYMDDLSSPIFTDCLFEENGSGAGGGAYATSGVQPQFVRCRFEKNTSSGDGGAVRCGSLVNFTDCSFRGNRSDADGGAVRIAGSSTGISPLEFYNCLFSGNVAQRGGAVANLRYGEPNFINCTFTGNSAAIEGGVGYLEYEDVDFVNSIFSNNRAAGLTNTVSATLSRTNGGVSNFLFSLVANSGGSASWDSAYGVDRGSNIDALPVFVVPVDLTTVPTCAGDLRLVSGSPGIDIGSNPSNSTPLDLSGNPRIANGTIDLGAYEGGVVLTDSDGDSLPDEWERSYSSNSSATSIGPDDDGDNDGLNALFELLHGFDPNVPNSPADANWLGEHAIGNATYLTISFPLNPAASEFLNFDVARSKNLSPSGWSNQFTTLVSQNGSIVTYRSLFTMPQTREFLRIELE